MTLQEIEKIDRSFLLPREVAEYMECDEHSIRVQAQQNADKLGFPVSVCGRRVRIPKEGFLYWCAYGRPAGCPPMQPVERQRKKIKMREEDEG